MEETLYITSMNSRLKAVFNHIFFQVLKTPIIVAILVVCQNTLGPENWGSITSWLSTVVAHTGIMKTMVSKGLLSYWCCRALYWSMRTGNKSKQFLSYNNFQVQPHIIGENYITLQISGSQTATLSAWFLCIQRWPAIHVCVCVHLINCNY